MSTRRSCRSRSNRYNTMTHVTTLSPNRPSLVRPIELILSPPIRSAIARTRLVRLSEGAAPPSQEGRRRRNDPNSMMFSCQRDQVVIIRVASRNGDLQRVRQLGLQTGDRATNSRASSALIRLRRRGRSRTSLISPINLGHTTTSNRAWPDIHTSISRVEGPRPIAADTNTFASITMRTGSAGTPSSHFPCLIYRQLHRLVVVQLRRRTARGHRFTHRAREVLPRRLTRHSKRLADLIPRHPGCARIRNEPSPELSQLSLGPRKFT